MGDDFPLMNPISSLWNLRQPLTNATPSSWTLRQLFFILKLFFTLKIYRPCLADETQNIEFKKRTIFLKIIIVIKRTKKFWNSDVRNCIKVIFKTRLILIDSRVGQKAAHALLQAEENSDPAFY